MTTKNIAFILLNAAIIFLFYSKPVLLLSGLVENDLYSHIFLIPFISCYFIYQKKGSIFSGNSPSLKTAAALISTAFIIYLVAIVKETAFTENDYLSLMVLSALVFFTGAFVLFWGAEALKKALFPIFFLLFMVPVPTLAMDNIILSLQKSSAEVSYVFFRLTGVPILREGLVFHLPRVSVEVAKECSGIRSSLALLITSILAGHMFLRTGWKKVVLALLIFPMTVFKNGIRIVTLSLLGAYVDISFLTDSLLHKRGGILFFIMALVLFTPIFWLLIKSEGGAKGRTEGIRHG